MKNINLYKVVFSEDKLEEILSAFKIDILSGIRIAGVAVGDTTSNTRLPNISNYSTHMFKTNNRPTDTYAYLMQNYLQIL